MTKKAICKICGCTDERACIVEGKAGDDIVKTCHWVFPDICSACMIAGRRIRIAHDRLFLGRWLEIGTEGILLEDVSSEDGDLYWVEIEGQLFSLAPYDFEVIE